MTRAWITVCVALAAVFPAGLVHAQPKEHASIIRIRDPDSPEHRRMTLMRLELTGQQLFCEMESSPRHRIQVRGLLGLQAPARTAAVPMDCRDLIRWGGRKYCYRKNENPVLDEILRQCASS